MIMKRKIPLTFLLENLDREEEIKQNIDNASVPDDDPDDLKILDTAYLPDDIDDNDIEIPLNT